jgi:AraC-like DNA-binding protein
MISYETSHPAVFRADEPFETLVVRVPKSLLGREAAAIANLTAVQLPCSDSLTRASATFFRRVAAALEAGTVSGDQATAAASRAVDLVRALYGRPHGDEPRRLRTRAEILLSVESFIAANLGDPQLSPEDIARASFVSTRYLHKLFESEGTSVCRWIRDARLEACRRDLLDPALAHQTILAIASRWGLPVPQHFSRLFRAAYGCSPRELRRDASRAGRLPASGAVA